MDFEFETARTGLANAFAEAGAELLNYMGASAAQAAIPDTQPQKYAIAGTLPGILQMVGKMMGEEGNIADLTEFTQRSIRDHADFSEDIERLSTADSRTRKLLRKEIYDSIDARVRNAVKAALASVTPVTAAEKPTGDLPPLPWGDDFEAWLEPRRQKDVAAAMHDYARAAIALHIASQPTGDLTDEQAWKIATDLFGTVRYVSREDEYVKIENAADAGQFARAAIAAHLERQVQATSTPEQVSAIGRLLDEFSALPVLWGLDEPGALVRHSDVFKMLVAAGKTYLAPASQEGAHAALEEVTEAAQILNSFVDNVSTDGPYGAEATLTFIGQAKQCVDAAIRALKASADGGAA